MANHAHGICLLLFPFFLAGSKYEENAWQTRSNADNINKSKKKMQEEQHPLQKHTHKKSQNVKKSK